MFLFYIFAVIVVLQGIASLRGGIAFAAFIRREMLRPRRGFTPFVSMIAPCRGLDQGLRENLTALLLQDYPRYEVIFVFDNENDPALKIVEEIRARETTRVRSQVVIAGDAVDCGQKVHNLRAAVPHADAESEVLVFVDTDARPGESWLESLVAPLEDEQVGAATGYRWLIPEKGGLSSHLRSVWNASIASALGERDDKNFCWGGATAIRKNTFERLNVLEKWRGTLSDDFALMRMLRAAKMPIRFVPACLTASIEDCGFRELLEFTTRQLKITRVYAPHFWLSVFVGSWLFVAVFFSGIAIGLASVIQGRPHYVTLILISLMFVLGAAKSYLRLQAVGLPLARYREKLRHGTAAHVLLWPFTSVLYLYNASCAALSRRIDWRGIVYELKSPSETVIIDRHNS